jgi:hypothetical protein
MPSLTDKPDYPLALRQADQARSDFAAIESEPSFRYEPARPAADARLCLSDVATVHRQSVGSARGRRIVAEVTALRMRIMRIEASSITVSGACSLWSSPSAHPSVP